MKLMSKNAEDRYQSEEGILEDLEHCIQDWQIHGSIKPFWTWRKDQSSILALRKKCTVEIRNSNN